MKTSKKAGLIVVLTIVALLAGAAALQARAISTTFVGTDMCIPVDFGEWTFPDGNIHIRGMKLVCTTTSAEPLVAGPNAVVMNANLVGDPAAVNGLGGVGPMWGTSEMAAWTGSYQGYMYADGSVFHAESRGTGQYEGLKLWLDSDHGVVSGRILNPHGD